MSTVSEHGGDVALAEQLAEARAAIEAEVAKVVIGQTDVLEQIFVAMLSGGHALLVGVPGLAKTLLVDSIARTLSLAFDRVQFTPDLMPSDITGTDVLEDDPATGRKRKVFLPGPIFTNILLADEVNRTPPRTQAALLQAMQERRVTIGGTTHPIPHPFFVLATQNPIEQEGTYPLPEAQLDRFLLEIRVDYPSREDEARIARATTGAPPPEIEAVIDGATLESFQALVRRVPVSEAFVADAVDLVRRTRPPGETASDEIRSWVGWGAGPRATQALVIGAKARALLGGRVTPSEEDLHALAAPVLRHRIVTSYAAEVDGIDADGVVAHLLRAPA